MENRENPEMDLRIARFRFSHDGIDQGANLWLLVQLDEFCFKHGLNEAVGVDGELVGWADDLEDCERSFDGVARFGSLFERRSGLWSYINFEC